VDQEGQIHDDPRLLIERDSRKTLYEALPFIAAFGMSSTEGNLKRIISRVSNMSLVSLDTNGHDTMRDYSNSSHPGGMKHSISNSSLLSDIDVDEIVLTIPMLMAVFSAILLEFLIGFNTSGTHTKLLPYYRTYSLTYSVMNAPEYVVFPAHTTIEWSLAVSAFAIGGPGGSLMGGFLANRKGHSSSVRSYLQPLT